MGEAEQDSAIWLLCHFNHVVKLNLYQPFSLSLTHLFFLSFHRLPSSNYFPLTSAPHFQFS